MTEAPRVCVDRVPPPTTYAERMALVADARWQPGDAIRVAFMDGVESVQQRVREQALVWTEYADLTLFFGDDPDADIRISFRQPGSWSYLGVQCRRIAPHQPTMNYGWLTEQSSEEEVRRVVLHEFGHALACIHEHQNPAGGINWNKSAVYEYYAGPPNHWSNEDVDHNLFRTYDRDLTVFTETDRQSIMAYPVPKEFTTDGFEIGFNTNLSDNDKAFIARMY